jgi:hypothetical protein
MGRLTLIRRLGGAGELGVAELVEVRAEVARAVHAVEEVGDPTRSLCGSGTIAE